jgi:hypothetical protein
MRVLVVSAVQGPDRVRGHGRSIVAGGLVVCRAGDGGDLPTSGRQPAVQSLVPIGGEGPEDPALTVAQPAVGGLEVQDHGDPAAPTVELAVIVGGDLCETQNACVETQWAVGVVLEDIGDVMRKAALQGLVGGRAHQCDRDQRIAPEPRDDGEASNLGDRGLPEQGIDIDTRVQEGAGIVPILGERRRTARGTD